VVTKALKSSESEAANRPRFNSPVIKPVARKTIRPSVFILVIFSRANNNNVKIKLFPLPVGRTAKTFFPRSKSLTDISCSRLKISSRFDSREAFSFTTAKRRHHETYVIHIKAYSLLSDSGPDSQPIINSRPWWMGNSITLPNPAGGLSQVCPILGTACHAG
jgi:hypothetical protein